MKIVLFQRNSPNSFSIENITENIATYLKEKANVSIHTLPFTNKGILNKIKNIVDSQSRQGDVNHITGDVHFISLALNRKKTILTIHDCEKLMGDDYGLIRKMIYKFFWFTLPKYKCKWITTISEESKKKLIQYAGISKKQIRVIHIGIDPLFQPLKLTKNEKASFLENLQRKKTILHVSDAKSSKNVKSLIQALEGLDVRFIKVGALAPEDKLLLSQQGTDCLQFQNVSLEDLVKIYNAVDALAFPSLVEGFGLPVVEAQKCGCPVLTSNVSSLPEVAGQGALLINPYSVTDIREGIKRLLSDTVLRETLILKGFENTKKFNWRKIAFQYFELYQEVREQ